MTETAPETARLTADVVLIGTDTKGREHVLLIRRADEPFIGHLALPGGHVDEGEEVLYAARRECVEETGLEPGVLKLVGDYSAPGRDPRGRYVTWAFLGQVEGLPDPRPGSDAEEAGWWLLADLAGQQLAFDHRHIIEDALGLMS